MAELNPMAERFEALLRSKALIPTSTSLMVEFIGGQATEIATIPPFSSEGHTTNLTMLGPGLTVLMTTMIPALVLLKQGGV